MDPYTFTLILVALVAVLGYRILKLLVRPRPGKEATGAEPVAEDELTIINEIRRGLARMEQRVEALETLLADQARERDRSSAGEKRYQGR